MAFPFANPAEDKLLVESGCPSDSSFSWMYLYEVSALQQFLSHAKVIKVNNGGRDGEDGHY